MAAALATQLGISPSAAQHAMKQIITLSGNHGVDPASTAFAAVAHELGVSPARLAQALVAAKRSVAGGGARLTSAGRREPAHNGRVRVLVVDDDPAVRRSLATALGRDGYEVLAADGGSAAFAHLAAAPIDVIVLDVAMPEPNGLEVCRRLRARGVRTPILMLTVRGQHLIAVTPERGGQ